MASSSQHSQENAGAKRRGGGQTVVELRGASGRGLVFWSRQRFETGVELQVRLRSDLLPKALRAKARGADWLNLRGFVVHCHSERRRDGSIGFLVSMLLASQVVPEREMGCDLPGTPSAECFHQIDWLGSARLGLN